MVQIEEIKFNTLLKFFFSDFFCDYLEEAIESEEKSIVTLFHGMDFFFEVIKEQGIEFPYNTKEEYITQTYFEGGAIYKSLLERYEKEISNYKPGDKSFEEIFGDLKFL